MKNSRPVSQKNLSAVQQKKSWLASQTLTRGLDILEAVASGITNIPEVADNAGLNRSTAHRLASALVERRYLTFIPYSGYRLGPKSLELGCQANTQMSIPAMAREQLERLAAQTGDTVHLGVLDGTRVLYLDKIPGQRRVQISSRVGELQPLRSTGLGKALLLDEDTPRLKEFYRCESDVPQRYAVPEGTWLRRMRDYAKRGCAFDLEENEDRVRCVAAPVRDAAGHIKAAISVSSAAQYMDDARMQDLMGQVQRTARQISRHMGWTETALRG